jgi:hypothetical protein
MSYEEKGIWVYLVTVAFQIARVFGWRSTRCSSIPTAKEACHELRVGG